MGGAGRSVRLKPPGPPVDVAEKSIKALIEAVATVLGSGPGAHFARGAKGVPRRERICDQENSPAGKGGGVGLAPERRRYGQRGSDQKSSVVVNAKRRGSMMR